MKKIILSFLFLSLSFSITAQKVDLNYYVPSDEKYDSQIPTPKEVIGHEVGEWHVTHDKLVEYMKALAKASERITLEDRGKTFEGRPLLLLTITSPNNHLRIDDIRQRHIEGTNNPSLDVSKDPIIVYQGFSIHGNEPSGSNASLAVAYYLAASVSSATENLLENTVILFDPSFNPDGLQRFAYWANTNKSKNINPDPNDREYFEVWPRGRTNHYWFDMNRDWLPVQLPESRARIASFHKWLPNVLTDHHEMGSNSTFFFQPGIPSRTHPLTPQLNQDLTREIGAYHAKAMDKIGSQYYSEESYDDFYYGKGSTFPDINGGIGILFEQGSSRGHAQETSNGILTFPFTIRNQYTAAMSTLEAAKNMRVKILKYQQDFYKKARNESSKAKAIVFGDRKDAAKSFHLAEVLKRHQVAIHEVKSDFRANGKQFKKGYSYIVPMNQKNQRLVKAMFDVRKSFKDSLFYDVSAWTLPYAFNLDYEYKNNIENIGKVVNDLKAPKGKVTNKGSYAYVFEAHNYYVPKLINKLQQKDIRIKVGLTPFTLEGNNYDYGTYMVPVKNQVIDENELYTILQKAAAESQVTIVGANTGHTEGIDLGSGDFSKVKKPEIALLVGDGVRSYDAGEIWHLLDTRHEITITKIDVRNLRRVDLSRYSHFIIPNFSGSGLDPHIDKIKEFVNEGGTLIGYRYTTKWLNKNEFITLDFLEEKIIAKNISFDNKDAFRGAQVTGGAIFNTKIDRSHPINFGYQNTTLPIFRNTNIFIKADENSYNNPIQYTNTPLLSGYISEENLALLKNTVPFKVNRMGKGRVIILTDNTNFRAFWYGTNRIITNALYLSDKM